MFSTTVFDKMGTIIRDTIESTVKENTQKSLNSIRIELHDKSKIIYPNEEVSKGRRSPVKAAIVWEEL